MNPGIGAYVEGAGGEARQSVQSRSLEDSSGKALDNGVRAGLVFDTCAACDSVFSYRLRVGGTRTWHDLRSGSDYNGFIMSHTFALAAVKNDYVKFWIGSQIGFAYDRGSGDRRLFHGEKAIAVSGLPCTGLFPLDEFFPAPVHALLSHGILTPEHHQPPDFDARLFAKPPVS